MSYEYQPARSDETFGAWMITLLIAGIPLVGFIYLLVLAFGSKTSPSKKNFARALFAWEIIAFLATALFISVFGGLAAFNGLINSN